MPKRRRVDDNLSAFRQHGFVKRKDVGTQENGDCPFCGKREHFYANKETKQWDCKSCGRSGGFQTFLKEIAEANQRFPDLENKLKILAEDRGLEVDTLKFYDIGFNVYTNEYTLPIYYTEGEETRIHDIRRYKMGGAFRSTSGCTLGVLGWERVPAYQRLWLCEGEWDAMACNEMLGHLAIESDMAVGLPGAGTLKTQWVSLFQDRDVVALYDADDPGRKGAQRAYNLLNNRVRSLQFVHWGEGVKDGYDFRDAYQDYNTGAYDWISSRLNQYPEGADISAISGKDSTQYDGKGVSAETVYETYTKWLYLPDTVLLDVIFGTVIANRQPGDPIWMFIVAPPGGTKTEPLVSLTESPDIIYRNTVSAKSLVSGQMLAGGADPFLLPRLHEKMLVIEDFTTVISIPAAYREEIFGILRSAYNGRFDREYGNGRIVRFDCHFGILAGVTPAIEHHSEDFAALGERFLSYCSPIPKGIAGRRPYLKKARENAGKENEMRQELLKVSTAALNYDFSQAPVMPGRIEDLILDAAQWTATMRGVVKREKYGASKDVTHEPYSELGTRLVKQYNKLCDGVGRFRRVPELTDNEFEIIRRIAYGSVPSDRRNFLKAVWTEPDRGWTTAEISDLTQLPKYPMCDRIAETLSLLGVLRKAKGVNGMRSTNLFHVHDDFGELTHNINIFR